MPSDVPGDDAKASDVRAGPGAAREEGNSVAAVPAVAVSEVAEAAAIANRAGVQPPIGSLPPVINVAIPVAALPVTITVRAPDEVSASTAAEPEPERNGWQHLIQPVLAMLVLLVAMAMDVFGLRTATDYASRDAFIKLYSLWYGRPHISDEIVVFTFRDEDLERIDANYRGLAEGDCSAEYTTWPLAYSDRLCMLNALVAAKPAAIFFDVPGFSPGRAGGRDRRFFDAIRQANDARTSIEMLDVRRDKGVQAEKRLKVRIRQRQPKLRCFSKVSNLVFPANRPAHQIRIMK